MDTSLIDNLIAARCPRTSEMPMHDETHPEDVLRGSKVYSLRGENPHQLSIRLK